MKNTLLKELKWDVSLQPIHTETGLLTERVAVVRNDSGKLLGVRSDRYRPFFNQEFEALVKRISEKPGFEFVGFEEFNNGKRILAFFENKQKTLAYAAKKLKTTSSLETVMMPPVNCL